MPLASLAIAFEPNAEGDNANLSFLKEGDVYDELNGVEICRKYETASNKKPSNATKMPKTRVDIVYMPEHIHTDNWFREHDKLPPDTELTSIDPFPIVDSSKTVSNNPVKIKVLVVLSLVISPLYALVNDVFNIQKLEGSSRSVMLD